MFFTALSVILFKISYLQKYHNTLKVCEFKKNGYFLCFFTLKYIRVCFKNISFVNPTVNPTVNPNKKNAGFGLG